MTKTISISEMRSKIAQISDEVQFKGIKYVVLKNGKPALEISPSAKSRNLNVDPALEKDLKEFEQEYGKLLRDLADR